MKPNETAGEYPHSHDVPTEPGVVVMVRDEAWGDRCSIWLDLPANKYSKEAMRYCFVDHVNSIVQHVDRVVLVHGIEDPNRIAQPCAWCHREGVSLTFIGLDEDADLNIPQSAVVLWDSAASDED